MIVLLSYNRLIELIDAGVINADKKNVNGTSIDITLGDEVMIETTSFNSKLTVDLANRESITTQLVKIPDDGFLLYSGQFILANSAEVFNLPRTISAEYRLKSTLARNGLQHMLAVWCDPGWRNSTLTMEISNTTQYHILKLRKGMKIGQMVFWEHEEVPEEACYSKTGQYNNQDTVTGSKGVR